ncbi:exonuclease domain-containing protein [Geopseudomonas aromaticivorans]
MGLTLDLRGAAIALRRYLLCVDLEATCDEEDATGARTLAVPREEMETIEVGAVLIDLERGGEVVAEFSSFVRPQMHPVLTEFCTRYTTISQGQVDAAPGHPEMALALAEFLRPYAGQWTWCSWGAYDRNQLVADAGRHGIAPALAPELHLNLKVWAAQYDTGKRKGLKRSVQMAGLAWAGTHHRGIDDARNLAALARVLLAKHATLNERNA